MVKFRWETEFKETEIGEIPNNWEVENLERVIKSLESGNRPKGGKLNHNPNGILSIGGENISWDGELILENCLRFDKEFYEKSKKGKIEKFDILLVKDGATIGKLAFVKDVPEGKAMVNEHIFLIKTDQNKYNPRFLYYYLFSEVGQTLIQNTISGSAQGGINKKFINSIKVPKLELSEQSRIASILSWFDDLIENKKKQNEILEKTAMAIFKSWFVDFEPFKGEELVFNEELGREIPKGWDVKAIGKIAEIRNGLSYTGKEKLEEPVEGSYIFITLNNAVEGGGFKPVYAWIKSNRIKEHHFIKEGDLIIPNTEQTKDERLLGSPGIVFFPPDYELDKGVYSMDIVRIMPTKYFYKYYLYLHLYFTREETATFHTGTSILHFDIRNFKKNKFILIPPQAVLEKFNNLIEPLFKKIILNQKQIMTLKKVRDTLLPLLVFGKLRVEEI
ncbi:restriction endonuclease subunit S [Caldicellulosiruptor morganii]|uniref:Restriction endonuclease subunit S n=1 Tax=Caldicellulosiruptor morganii TaxID=1387555 RepID=A0ABY7BQC7_9FIRM|nr:restriction endonuclease subunit S [Caldicellulosiruptor morganii]WAM34097.1 restriction endonuclease subunit S [Caldicellulosiruptor morganii]